MLHVQSLSKQLNTAVMSSATKFQHSASPDVPFGYYDYLAVYHPEEHTAASQLQSSCQTGKGSAHVLCGTYAIGTGKGVWPVLMTYQMQALNEQAHSFAFDIIFQPLKDKLLRIPNLEVNTVHLPTLPSHHSLWVCCRAGLENWSGQFP